MTLGLAFALLVLIAALALVAFSVYDTRRNFKRIDAEGQREIDWWNNWLKARQERRRRGEL